MREPRWLLAGIAVLLAGAAILGIRWWQSSRSGDCAPAAVASSNATGPAAGGNATGPAAGGNATGPAAGPSGDTAGPAVSDPSGAADYWTPERMREARGAEGNSGDC